MLRTTAKFIIIFGLLFFTCSPKEESKGLDYKDRIKHRQYIANGRVLYVQLCANCHQLDGSGLGKLYPPLLRSDYMIKDTYRTINIIKNGLKGEIMVNGVLFNQEMPPNPKLTNLDIAELTAYIFIKFADSVVLVSPIEVEAILKANL